MKPMWMKIHFYLSLFFLPAACIYALSGVFYAYGFKEDTGAKIHLINVPAVTQGQEVQTIIDALQANHLKVPSNTQLWDYKGSPSIGSLAYNASLLKEKNGMQTIKVTERSLYGVLVLMHKAKGKAWFDVIMIGFASTLLLLYVSGLIMTSFVKKKRVYAFGTFALGLCVTGLAIYMSV